MNPSRKAHHREALRRHLLRVVGTTVLIVFAALVLWNSGRVVPRLTPDGRPDDKARILAVASSDAPLTFAERETLFALLSGQRMLKYHFTEAEKQLIVDTLNNRKERHKSSSAREDFSRAGPLFVRL